MRKIPNTERLVRQSHAGTGRRPSSTRAADGTSVSPFAVILICSDACVVPEELFGVEPGQLHVLQNPGNIVTDREVEEVRRMKQEHDISLAIVLGHSKCRALASSEHELSTSVFEEIRESRAAADDGCVEQLHAQRMAARLRERVDNTGVASAFLDEDGLVTFSRPD